MMFALTRTTPLRRDLFWNRHFLIAKLIYWVYSIIENLCNNLTFYVWWPLRYRVVNRRVLGYHSLIVFGNRWRIFIIDNCLTFFPLFLFSFFIYFSGSYCFLNRCFLFIYQLFRRWRNFKLFCFRLHLILLFIIRANFRFKFLWFLLFLFTNWIKVILNLIFWSICYLLNYVYSALILSVLQ